jgi:hypothetical protein
MLVTDMVYITSFVKRYQEEDADLWYVCVLKGRYGQPSGGGCVHEDRYVHM